jgi:hypothetical protein
MLFENVKVLDNYKAIFDRPFRNKRDQFHNAQVNITAASKD